MSVSKGTQLRSQFTFYKSFDDVIEDMTDKQIVEYVKAVLDVQFLRKRISEISFDDKVLSMVWKSQKHSITSSIDGYLNSQKKEGVTNPYFGAYATPSEGGFFTPSHDPYEGGRQQEEGKGEVQVKGKEESKVKEKGCRLENLPTDKKNELYSFMKEHCMESGVSMIEIEKFSNYWISIAGAKGIKTNWKLTFKNWCLSDYVKKQSEQRMDISKLPEGVSLQDMLNEAGEQWEREQEQKQIGVTR